jgi:hypothetical protein
MSSPRRRYTRFTLDNSWLVEFPTPDGVLRVGPGPVRIDARLSVRQTDEEGYWWTILDCELRLADTDSRLWQATSTFNVDWLFYPLIDLSRREPGRWLRKAPDAWREALQKHSLIRDVQNTYDDRFYRYAWFDNTGFCWQFHYFGATFQVAALDASSLVVGVSKLWCTWNPVPAAGEDGAPLPLPPAPPPLSDEEQAEEDERQAEAGESGDIDEAAPLAYVLDAERLLFHDTARYRNPDDRWAVSSFPRVPVFRRVKGRGDPQRLVTFHSGRHLTPALSPSPDDAEGFIDWEDSYCNAEFQTDAGGRLLVGSVRYRVRLDLHPGSAGEPMDVLRCRVRLTDDAGDVWEAVSLFTPEVFFERLIDLDSIHCPVFGPGPEGEGLLSGVRALLDGGWRYAFIGDELVAFRGEQRPVIALARGEDARDVVVCITGLVGRRRPVEIDHDYILLDPAARQAERVRWDQDARLPPIVYQMPLGALLFRNTTFAVDDGFWHHNAIPIPVVFSRVGKAAPGEGVRFEAGVG